MQAMHDTALSGRTGTSSSLSQMLFFVKGMAVAPLGLAFILAPFWVAGLIGIELSLGGGFFVRLLGTILAGIALSLLLDAGARNPSRAGALSIGGFDLVAAAIVATAWVNGTISAVGLVFLVAFLGSAATYALSVFERW